MTLEERLYDRPTAFDFFQTVSILETIKGPAGDMRRPIDELLRFKTFPALVFPSSSVKLLRQRLFGVNKPHVFVNFFGLIGPQGALPLHYTLKTLNANEYDKVEDLETSPMLEWLDLFNHRMLALFYSAWEKYRFPVTFFHQSRLVQQQKRTQYRQRFRQTDDFTQAMFCFVGMGVPATRDRLRFETSARNAQGQLERIPLAAVSDLALLHYAGNLSHRPRHVSGLRSLLKDYFALEVEVEELTGQWLELDQSSQTRFTEDGNCSLGENVICGQRIWDFNSMFRLKMGPLTYRQFIELLPDASPTPRRKSFYLLSQLTRYYVGSEFDFDVQLLLRGDEVPECELNEPGEGVLGARLGWNTWLLSDQMPDVVEEAIFLGDDRTSIEASMN